MSDENSLGFKFYYISWMTDQEIVKLIAALPKRDPTNFMGHLEIETISLACKMSNEIIVKRVLNSLSANDRTEFLKVSTESNNSSIEEIMIARKQVEQIADQLEIQGEIGGWWQKYAV